VEGMGGRIVIEKQGVQFSWGTGVYRWEWKIGEEGLLGRQGEGFFEFIDD